MFSGIGGFRTAMENNGHECIAYSEIDKYAKQSYQALYDTENEIDLVEQPKYHDKTKGKKKFDEIHNWAVDNINYVELLPELQTEVTTRLIDVLEDEVDEKYYLSEEKTQKLTLDEDLGGKLNHFNYNEMDRVYSIKKVSPTLNTMQGGNRQPKIAVKGFKEVVEVRKYDVNKLELSELLRISKQDAGISNKEISNTLNVPITKVEHWFRTDKSFAIPDASVWFELKQILNITNTDHDEAITTFISKESNFDTTNRIYDANHLSPTLNTTSEPKVAVLGNTSNTGHRSHDVHDTDGIIPTIAARDYKGAKQIAVPVLTPDRLNKRQNGRRFKEDGEPMFTLTSQDKHGIAIREVTKQVAQTLQAGEVNKGVVIGGDFDAKEIERNTFEILQTLQKEIGEKEITEWRSRILDTFQQEEILRQDVYEKGLDIEQDEKKLERKEQSGERKIEDRTFDGQKVLRKMPIDKEFRCSPHGRESIQQFARELTSIMQKLSHETSQEKNLYHLRETTQGIRLLQQTLYKIQEIWESKLLKKQSVRIRKLTEKECWLLQGFTDEQFYKAKNSGVSKSQLYKQAGNSVSVPVVDAIVKCL